MHVMRASKKNARQGFWNSSLPPIYCTVAAEQRGAKVKKKLEIDPGPAGTKPAVCDAHQRRPNVANLSSEAAILQ